MRKYYSITLWMMVLILLASVAVAQTVTVTDMVGRSVATPRDPQRVVCIGPGTLRLIVYLQAEGKVVGVEDMEKAYPGGRPYWLAHPELAKLPRCGPGGPAGIDKKPDMETILSLAPQVIFITYMDKSLADEVQQTLGIPVVVLSYGAFATFDEAVLDSVRIAGKVLNREQRAGAVISYINKIKSDLETRGHKAVEGKKPSVYVGGIGYRGSYGIESTEQKYIPFSWVGADNLADRVKADAGSHVFMDKEMLLKLNPDVIFIDGGGIDLTEADYKKKPEYYHALKAFSEHRVYALHPFNWYVTNIGTALSDAYAIGKILDPEGFHDIDPAVKADEIYTFLVGKPVYTEMENAYGKIGRVAPFLN